MAKEQFILANHQIYLCGHSLGPSSYSSLQRIEQAINEWKSQGVLGWHSADWIDLPNRVAAKIAALLGTRAECVAVCDSTSVNLYKVLMTALQLNSQRSIILTTEDIFPTDRYIAEGITRFHPEITTKKVATDEIEASLSDRVAVLIMSHVDYRSGNIVDLQHITQLAQQQGILVIWDLCHSVGIVPIDLDKCEVDFAVGCTYKYLKGGPGSPAFLYVHEKYHAVMANPIQGWMGHRDPFEFIPCYQAKSTAKQFMVGTPNIFSLAALEGALDLFTDIDLKLQFQQTQTHTAFIKNKLKERCLPTNQPGGHVAIKHADAGSLCAQLIQGGFIVDYRPGLIRVCVDPMYITLDDLHFFTDFLEGLL